MDDNPKNPGDSSAEVEELRRRLAEAEGTLDAIRRGMVDAFVVEDGQGERVYTLKGAEKAYSVFIETINEGLVALDSSNNILYSNTAFAHLVGSSSDRVSGSSAHRFIKEEDRPLFDRLVAQSIGGQTGRREFSVLTETCDLVPMLLSFSDLEIGGLNGACIILTDLTEQKHAAHDLQEQYSMLSGIVESSNSPIFSIDEDYLYSSFNSAHVAVMKALYDVDIEPGKSILACMTVEEDRIEAKRNLDRALQGEQFVEAAYSGDEGLSRKYFEVTHSPIRNELGEVTGVAVFSSDQTESKQAEDALRKSEEYFRLLFDNAGEAIFACDSELIMTDINRIGCELIGYGREELVGNNILELGILHPDDMENASTAIRRLFDGEDRIETESTFIRKDGATRLAVVTGAAIRDPDGSLRSFIDICHDITEERRVEEALRQTSDYLESLLDYANAPIIVWDNEFKVRRFNYAFERFTGYAADEVTNGTPNILFPVETREESLGLIERTLSGEHWESVEIPILRKDGDTRIALWNSANIYDKDGKTIIATIAQGQDITERKKAEESIKKNSEELKDLIEIAAHELRHPATVFRGYAQILMANWEDLDRGTIQDALCRIDEATNRLIRLVISLLETSHIERGRIDLSLSEVDPVAPVRRAIEEFRSRELDRELRLTCAGFDNEEMDAEKVKQVLEILIDNAVKYSDKECPVDIECEKGEGEIVYRVADLGPGIPDEDRERIFERFYQVGDVLHHSVHGIGLGLYIAKAIVEVHGGWISEEPRDGGGSVFSFGIPAVRESDHVQDGSHMGVAG